MNELIVRVAPGVVPGMNTTSFISDTPGHCFGPDSSNAAVMELSVSSSPASTCWVTSICST